MADEKRFDIIYPKEPSAQPPMPEWRRPSGPPPPPTENNGQQPPRPRPRFERPDMTKRGLWGAHDPAIYRDPVSGDYFAYCTHQNVYRSPDMVDWKWIGGIINETPEEVFAWTNSHGLWAPDIIKVGDEYRMYCSTSSFGVQLSCIYLAVSDKPEGPYEYRGIVVKTNKNSAVNAIDANLVVDEKTGEQYMAFGSFWGGIRLMKLDPETGLAADKSECEDGRSTEEAMGPCICCRPLWCDRAVEGAYIRYNKETDYYYLFVSYGSLSSDYNIRVGRSRNIMGPYLDFHGKAMTDTEDHEGKTGLMIACGYRFEDSRGWMGPGHNSVLVDDDGWYLVCHIRPYGVYKHVDSTMHIRRILWSEDGWPILSPENYAGEPIQPIPEEAIYGRYEWITLTPSVPQSVIGSAPATIMPQGGMHISSHTRIRWEKTGDYGVKMDLGGGHTIDCKVLAVWDAENGRPTVAITGITNDGVAVWAKKVADMPPRRLGPGSGGPTV